MSDALHLMLRLNFGVSAAVLAVLALRLPLRRLCGAEAAYGIWSLVPLSAVAMLAPVRVVTVHAPRAAVAPPLDLAFAPQAPATLFAPTSSPALASLLIALWLAGALASLAWLVLRQAQFARAMRAGRAGPAVVGVLRPRIVVPSDFQNRYSLREQHVVIAHERAHLARHDSRVNALAAVARSLAWFNPLVHLLVHLLRIDQELACDARVVAAHPQSRRTYAEAMLKAQLAARPLPLGCYWLSPSSHPLAQRVALIGRATPSRLRRRLGLAAVTFLATACAASAWAGRPARIITLVTPVAAPAAPAARPAASAPGVAKVRTRTASEETAQGRAPSAPDILSGPAVRETTPDGATSQVTATAPDAAPMPAPDPGPSASDENSDQRYRPHVTGAARRSSVEPGTAVRVVASLMEPEGGRLITDLTSFGSQNLYRAGIISRPPGSRYALFTSVIQQGDRYLVTASLGSRFAPPATGTVRLAAGESGRIFLPNGAPVKVDLSVRPETPEEAETGRRALEREAAMRIRTRQMPFGPFQCGRRGAIC